MNPRHVRIESVGLAYEDHLYRSPIKFGGVALDRATLLNVRVTAETRSGQTAEGFGSMPLACTWAFPTRKHTYDETLAAMKELAVAFWETVEEHTGFGHPVELGHDLEPKFLAHLAPVTAELKLQDPIP